MAIDKYLKNKEIWNLFSEIMSKMFEELEQKFTNIQTKIELKQQPIKNLIHQEKKSLKKNLNEKILLEKYSNDLKYKRFKR